MTINRRLVRSFRRLHPERWDLGVVHCTIFVWPGVWFSASKTVVLRKPFFATSCLGLDGLSRSPLALRSVARWWMSASAGVAPLPAFSHPLYVSLIRVLECGVWSG